jgi:hypothetical protein
MPRNRINDSTPVVAAAPPTSSGRLITAPSNESKRSYASDAATTLRAMTGTMNSAEPTTRVRALRWNNRAPPSTELSTG